MSLYDLLGTITDRAELALIRPEHCCDGTESGCLNSCPAPAIQVLPIRELAYEIALSVESAVRPPPLTSDEFHRLPSGSIVEKLWPWQTAGDQPEIWARLHSSRFWVELTDIGNSHEQQCASDIAYSDGAIHRIVWTPPSEPIEARR